MKKTIKIIVINIAVLSVLLIILEIVLRLVGMESLHGLEKKKPNWEQRYLPTCKKILKTPVVFYNQFYTDREGFFKANPQTFAGLYSRARGGASISINKDGFRGNEFKYLETSKPKILLIGDSFTWGAAAQPITNSYADLLQNTGYYVYNGGIPGTDLQQYAMVAEKYTPLLKPDVVAVCVYMGNDVSTRPQLVKPGKNLHYDTSVGFLLGYDDNGNFFKNAGEAFLYLKKRKCGYCSSLWDYFLFKTVIGKGVYALFNKGPGLKYDKDRKWITAALEKIQEVCRKNNSEFIIFLVPFKNQDTAKAKSIERNLPLFEGFCYYYPKNLEKSDYQPPPDKHFNNKGHRKFADFIIGILKQKGYYPGV